MASNRFDADPKVQNILRVLANTEISAAVLDEAEKLDADRRAYLADRFLPMIQYAFSVIDDAENIREMQAYVKTKPKDVMTRTEENFALISRIVSFIFNAKADKSDAIIKLYAKEAAKLTDAKYSRPENHIKLFLAVAKKNVAAEQAAPPPNPFRKNNPQNQGKPS